MEPRLKAGIWVRALIRRCASQTVPALVVRKGDESAGTVFVKVNRLNGRVDVFSPARKGDGRKVWMHALGPDPVPETDADAYLARQAKFDPDIWVVEIEDREGRHFLGEEVDLGGEGLIP